MTKSLWRQRNFMLLWSGQLASWIGTEVSGIALPLVVLALTGSPAQAGKMAAVRGFVYVFWAIPAGIVIDRWDRRLVMVGANVGSGLAMGSVALSFWLHHLSLVQLYAASAIEGSFFVFANLGRFAAAPKVVSKEQFPAASAQMGTASHLGILIGPPLGGFLYQVAGGFLSFLTDALSYFINAVSLCFINVPLGSPSPAERKAVRHEIAEAMAWFWQQPVLRFLNLLTAGRAMLTAGLYLLVIVLAKEHQASGFSTGLIFAVGAGGGIAGSFAAAKIHSRYGMKHLLTGVSLCSVLVFACYAFAINTVLVAGVTALFYAIDPLYNVTTSSYSVRLVPDAMRGRVSSLTRLVVLGAHSFGFFMMGILLSRFGSRGAIGFSTGLLLALFLLTVLNKRLAHVDLPVARVTD